MHRPDIWQAGELSDFEKAIIETGNEVELVARHLFPGGFLVPDRSKASQEMTSQLIAKNEKFIFQPIFIKDGFLAAVDVLENNGDGTWNIYEIKSTSDVDKKTHYHDLAFQVNLLEKCGLKINKAHIIHLNSEYVKSGELEVVKLFKIIDATETVNGMKEAVGQEMEMALKYLSQETEPAGYCSCVYKGRSSHCSTFQHSNPKVPAYGIHDIVRIGTSRALLQELADVGMFELTGITEEILKKLSLPQQNQVISYVENRILIDQASIKRELESLVFPLYFLDYETFPSAIPIFDNFSPYQQIPFQYSLYVLGAQGKELNHFEFIFSQQSDPSKHFIESLQKHISPTGSIIVWNKRFEGKINEELGKRNPDAKIFMADINSRLYDLMDIFGNQYYVHKDFKGRISIKNVLPVLVPELSYKTLNIKEGGTASQKWKEAVLTTIAEDQKQQIINDLKEYCKMDTLAMCKIWECLTYL